MGNAKGDSSQAGCIAGWVDFVVLTGAHFHGAEERRPKSEAEADSDAAEASVQSRFVHTHTRKHVRPVSLSPFCAGGRQAVV